MTADAVAVTRGLRFDKYQRLSSVGNYWRGERQCDRRQHGNNAEWHEMQCITTAAVVGAKRRQNSAGDGSFAFTDLDDGVSSSTGGHRPPNVRL